MAIAAVAVAAAAVAERAAEVNAPRGKCGRWLVCQYCWQLYLVLDSQLVVAGHSTAVSVPLDGVSRLFGIAPTTQCQSQTQ